MSNIIKETAKELGMTYAQVAEAIGVSEGTLSNASSTGKISNQIIKSLELLAENKKMKKDLEIVSQFKDLVNK